ncbi:hypothetical protein KKF84_11165, partial [Myxococcota bacterium]|nr:hypothetical protein [Myxococcota bacterium]
MRRVLMICVGWLFFVGCQSDPGLRSRLDGRVGIASLDGMGRVTVENGAAQVLEFSGEGLE